MQLQIKKSLQVIHYGVTNGLAYQCVLILDFNIDDSRFEEMAKNACGKNGVIRGYVDLTPEDVVNIYRMCL